MRYGEKKLLLCDENMSTHDRHGVGRLWRHSPVTSSWPETRGNMQGIDRYNALSRCAGEAVLLCAIKTYRRTTDTVLAGCGDSKGPARCGDREGLPRWKRTRKIFRYDHMGRQEESRKKNEEKK